MAELKTKENNSDVNAFIVAATETEQRRMDCIELLKLMENWTGFKPKMWGGSIIGFGKYHYKSERSKQEGDWPLVGFSPRKAAISLYVYSGCAGQEQLLADLGKYKMGKACMYVKKLADIKLDVLQKIVVSTTQFLQSKYS
jgi:hypothetical protein